jgi:hypothetical protein
MHSRVDRNVRKRFIEVEEVFEVLREEGDVVCYVGDGCPTYYNPEFTDLVQTIEGQNRLRSLFHFSDAILGAYTCTSTDRVSTYSKRRVT